MALFTVAQKYINPKKNKVLPQGLGDLCYFFYYGLFTATYLQEQINGNWSVSSHLPITHTRTHARTHARTRARTHTLPYFHPAFSSVNFLAFIVLY